jgi:Ca2+-transporting ATPase
LVHPIHAAVKGRSRFKVAGLYRSDSCRTFLEIELSKQSDILSISASTLTGNLLVIHNPGRTSTEIAVVILRLVLTYSKRKKSGRPQRVPIEKTYATITRNGSRLDDNRSSRRIMREMVVRAEPQKGEPWHLMRAADVLDNQDSDGRLGLSGETAILKISKFGPNMLPESVPRSGLSIFLSQFKSFPVALLGVAGGISIFTGGIVDAIVIAAVVAINAAIGYVTESGSEKTIHSLKRLVRPNASVIRGGVIEEKSTEEIVPGDILVLRPGSYSSKHNT